MGNHQSARTFKKDIEGYLPVFGGRRARYGIGCAWFGRSGDYRETLKSDLDTLERAYEHGFRYFDTARAYGESECTLGEFVRSIDRATVFLATKSSFHGHDDPASSLRTFKDNFYRSFERLKTDRLDLFQIHDIADFVHVATTDGALEFLVNAREQGLIRLIGVATYLQVVLLPAARHGAVDTVLSYRQYTPLKVSAKSIIEETAALNVGFINASPLHAGFLTNIDPMKVETDNHPVARRWQEIAVSFHSLCAELPSAVLDVALQFPMRNSHIDVTLTGPVNKHEVDSSVRALRHTIPAPIWEAVAAWQESVYDRYEE